MSPKKSGESGPPIFPPRKKWVYDVATGDGSDKFCAWLRQVKGTRTTLKETLEDMKSLAAIAQNAPDQYNTHQPAQFMLNEIPDLEALLQQPDDATRRVDHVLELVHSMAIATQWHMKLYTNATLTVPRNEKRRRDQVLARIRPKGPIRSEREIRRVLATYKTLQGQMTALGVGRATMYSYRAKFGRDRKTLKK